MLFLSGRRIELNSTQVEELSSTSKSTVERESDMHSTAGKWRLELLPSFRIRFLLIDLVREPDEKIFGSHGVRTERAQLARYFLVQPAIT